jgi:hypothetical protein
MEEKRRKKTVTKNEFQNKKKDALRRSFHMLAASR